MYKQRLTQDEQDALKRGHLPTLRRLLKQSDEKLTEDLKKCNVDNVKFLQGASHIVDELLKYLG